MSGFFQDLLKDTAKGFFGSEYLRDYTHASQTFRTNAYQFAPKYKFLFHVYFDINYQLLGDSFQFPGGNKNFFGLAVKTVQLPKYTFDLHTMNQYNRPRVVQTKIKYDPINITFHDDNGNLIRKLWYNYYSYYYKDSVQTDPYESYAPTPSTYGGSPTFASAGQLDMNTRNLYQPSITGNDDWGYVGESGNGQQTNLGATIGSSKAPFFRSINVYGFNQHNFVMYKLINPIIESFSHDTYDYSASNGIMEHQMTLRYETVKYYEGAVDGKDPSKYVPEFGDVSHYDRTLSPIARPGSNASILGQGGLVDGVGGVMQDLKDGNWIGAIQKTGAMKNTFKNPQNILKIAKSESLAAVAQSINPPPNSNNPFKFPVADIAKNINGNISNFLGKPPNVG